MAPKEIENNAYAKFWGDKQRVLCYVMVFSGVVNDNHSYCVTHNIKDNTSLGNTQFSDAIYRTVLTF